MKKGLTDFLKFACPHLRLPLRALEIIGATKKTMKLPIKLAIGSGVTFLVVIIFGFIIFPRLTKSKIKGQVALKPGSEIRKLYTKTPFAIDFKVYLFNITNADEVLKGDSPVLDEIGPYVYDFWKEKVNVVDNEVNDTMTYNQKMTFIFNATRSKPLTGKEIVTLPHPLIMAMALMTQREKPAMLSIVSKAIKSIYNDPDTPFVTATANEFLFDGLLNYCNVTDFAGKAVCTQLKTEAKDLVYISDNVFKLSFFGSKNGTVDERPFMVKRGIKNYKDIGRMVAFDNKYEMNIWTTKECNQYQGTDSTIFPPLLVKEEGIVAFAPDLCRSIKGTFDREDDFKGLTVYRYTASLGDMSKDKDLKCFCPKPDYCLKKGLMDLSKCVGAPLYTSLPHFYDSDESYVHGVRGLHPREEDHGIDMFFEPMTGTPLSARKRLQFSLPLEPIEKVKCMKNLPRVVLPMFWVEEGAIIGDEYVNQIKAAFNMLKAVNIIKWLLLVGSLLVAGVACFLYFHTKTTVQVTSVHKSGEKSRSSVIQTIHVDNLNGSEDKPKY